MNTNLKNIKKLKLENKALQDKIPKTQIQIIKARNRQTVKRKIEDK